MVKLLLSTMLMLCCAAGFALSSTTNSANFTMDTVAPDITIVAPNGGEAWYIGDTNNITWTAEDTNLSPNTVYLWYSLSGSEYLPLAESIPNSGTWPWLMPEIQSYTARVRIETTDSFGNVSQKTSAEPFSITFVPPTAPANVQVDISNLVDAIITWDPVTETIYGTPIIPDGYIKTFAHNPQGLVKK